MPKAPEALQVWRRVVPTEWIDYNEHLTEGYYGVAFADASDELLVYLGFGPEYRAESGTFYTVETRIRFLSEVHKGAEIATASYLLGADSKRLHVHHDLLADQNPSPVATQEVMLLHVSQDGQDGQDGHPRVSPMREPILTRALELAAAHSLIPVPDHVGRGVRTL